MNLLNKWFDKWFNKPLKLTTKEGKIFKACELILSRKDREISVIPGEMDYLIKSNDLDYFLHVTSEGITFSNHGHTVTRDYRIKFVELIKETIKEKTIIDRNQMISDMSHNEDTLLDKMIENLSMNWEGPGVNYSKKIEIVKD
jgi:hypothetical protein